MLKHNSKTLEQLTKEGAFHSGKSLRKILNNDEYIFLDIASEDYSGYFVIGASDGLFLVPTYFYSEPKNESIYNHGIQELNEDYKEFLKGFIKPIEDTGYLLEEFMSNIISEVVNKNSTLSYKDFLNKASTIHQTEVLDEYNTDYSICLAPYKDHYIGSVLVFLSDANIIMPITSYDKEVFHINAKEAVLNSPKEKSYLETCISSLQRELEFINSL